MKTDSPEHAGIRVRIIRSASGSQLEDLYKDAGWWDAGFENHPETLDRIVRQSALFAGAFSGEKMVGMGRALSDLVSDAYIQDVAVLKTYRGQGIGKMIVRALIINLKQHGVDWIGLLGQPGTTGFYRELGFKELKGHTPFKLEE